MFTLVFFSLEKKGDSYRPKYNTRFFALRKEMNHNFTRYLLNKSTMLILKLYKKLLDIRLSTPCSFHVKNLSGTIFYVRRFFCFDRLFF